MIDKLEVIKNKVISDIHCIGFNDGTFEFNIDGKIAYLDSNEANDLLKFLKKETLYGLVDDQIRPVNYL